MTTIRRTRSFAALAAAAALTLSACGGGDDSSSEDTETSSATSEASTTEDSEEEGAEDDATSQESAEGESETSEEGAAASEGSVTAEQSGVTFDVPEGWTSIAPKELLENAENIPPEFEELAKAQGTTGEQLLQNMAQSVDVMVIGEAKDGFANNVNVVASPQMPTESQVKSQLEQTGATVSGTEEVETAIGTALATDYTLSMGGQTIHGRMLSVPTDSGSAMITASTLSAQESEQVTKTILDTVDKA